MDKSYRIVYSKYIIQHSHTSNYSVQNQRDLVLDTVENLTQIGHWTLESYTKERERIELFLTLTRKNFNALLSFPLPPTFDTKFKKICDSYDKLEEEYRAGLVDKTAWANGMLSCGSTLTQNYEATGFQSA